MTGRVQFVNKDKAYGFIQCEDYPKGVFFHIKNFNGAFDTLVKGDEVQFSVISTPKGIAAENVDLI